MLGRLRIIGAALLVGLVALVVWLTVFNDGDGSSSEEDADRPRATAPPASSIPLDTEAQSLADLLEIGQSATYHATYEATGGENPYRLDVYRRAGDFRQESTSETAQGETRTAGLLVDGVAIVCNQPAGEEWICSETTGTDDSATLGVFGTLVEGLAGREVTESTDTIDGRSVRCFAYELDAGPGRICVDAEGVPIRVETSGTTLELVEFEEEVDESVFEPPAEPVQVESEG